MKYTSTTWQNSLALGAMVLVATVAVGTAFMQRPPPVNKFPWYLVDDGDSGFFQVGGWRVLTDRTIPGFAFDQRFVLGRETSWIQKDPGHAHARWTFQLPKAGAYDVYATWNPPVSDADREQLAPAAPYTIIHAEGSDTVEVDQSLEPEGEQFGGPVIGPSGNRVNQKRPFQLLGSYNFGKVGVVELFNAGVDGAILADAIFVRAAKVADLQLALTVGSTSTKNPNPDYKPGSAMQYTYSVMNRGPSAATNVTLVGQLPNEFILSTTIDKRCKISGRDIVCAISGISAKRMATIRIRGTISKTAACDTQLTARGDVAAKEKDPNPANNTEVVTDIRLCHTGSTTGSGGGGTGGGGGSGGGGVSNPRVPLSANIVANATVAPPSGDIIYTATIGNLANVRVMDVKVTLLTSNFERLKKVDNPGCKKIQDKYECAFALNAGQSISFDIVAEILDEVPCRNNLFGHINAVRTSIPPAGPNEETKEAMATVYVPGRCSSSAPPSKLCLTACCDTDGGVNRSTWGEIIIGGGTNSVEDGCTKSFPMGPLGVESCAGDGCKQVEMVCNGTNAGNNIVDCPQGCSYGRCPAGNDPIVKTERPSNAMVGSRFPFSFTAAQNKVRTGDTVDFVFRIKNPRTSPQQFNVGMTPQFGMVQDKVTGCTGVNCLVTVAPNETKEVRITARVLDDARCPNDYMEGRGSISWVEGNTQVMSPIVIETIKITCGPGTHEMAIEQTVSKTSVSPGDVLDYSFTVRNKGNQAEPLVLVNAGAVGLLSEISDSRCESNGEGMGCKFWGIPAGGSVTVRAKSRVEKKHVVCGSATNATAKVNYVAFEQDGSDNQALTRMTFDCMVKPEMTFTFTAQANAARGGEVAYIVQLRNDGDVTADTYLRFPWMQHAEYINATGCTSVTPGGNQSTPTQSCYVGLLGPGQTRMVTFFSQVKQSAPCNSAIPSEVTLLARPQVSDPGQETLVVTKNGSTSITCN